MTTGVREWAPTKQELAAALKRARELTLRLVEPVADEDLRRKLVQPGNFLRVICDRTSSRAAGRFFTERHKGRNWRIRGLQPELKAP
jgi:hypothetical protein